MIILTFSSVTDLFPLEHVKKGKKRRKLPGHSSENAFSKAYNSQQFEKPR